MPSEPPVPPRSDDLPAGVSWRPSDREAPRKPHHLHVLLDWLERARRRRAQWLARRRL